VGGGGAKRKEKNCVERRNGIGEKIKVFFTNARSIVGKMSELKATISVHKPDILAITETWTNDSIGDDFLKINGYEIIERNDRKDTGGGRGGGILIYVRTDIGAWREEPETSFNQCAMVKLKCKYGEVKLAVVYRSPNSIRTNDDALCEWIRSMRGNSIIIGDFNFPDIDWQNGSAGTRGRSFFETINDKFMHQHVEAKTHDRGNILDLIISSSEELVNEVGCEGKLGTSDHEIISFCIRNETNKREEPKTYRDFSRANVGEMRGTMQRNWHEIMAEMSVNQMWEEITNTVNRAIEDHVPLRKRKNHVAPKWFNNDIRKCIEQKKRAWNQWKKLGRVGDRDEYKKLEKETKKKVKNSKKNYEKKVAKMAKSDPKVYYSYINSAKKMRSKIGPLKNGNEVISEPAEQVKVLNEFFASVFTTSQNATPKKEKITDKELNNVFFTEEKVGKIIDGLKKDAAPGPDGIPAKILKDEIVVPLTILFRKSMAEGQIPDAWRDANVTPIFKKGSKAAPGNYRPVNLTSGSGKAMERGVKDEMETFIEKNNLMTNTQHGFRKGKSPQTNLIEFLNETTKWLDENHDFDIIYLDFAKAFDKVCHKRLIVKLETIGITGNLLNWVKDWLSNRRQRVVIDGECAEWIAVVSSVLQGSVLGGLLFNVFIDDIDDAVKFALLKKFADDTKLAMKIKNEEDAIKLQDDLNRIAKWAEEWKMQFNADKCKVMHVGNSNKRFEYRMNNVTIEAVNEERDLGVTFESTLKPARQCEKAAQTAMFALGQISRSFHFRSKAYLVPLYKTFVRPKMEFAVAAWSPWMEKDIAPMEHVQEELMKMISDVRGATHKEKLQDAGLTTLQDRRERGDMIEVFKVLNGIEKVDKNLWFKIQREEARPTRMNTQIQEGQVVRREDVLVMENVRLEVRRNFFTVRVIRNWNSLPDSVWKQNSVNAFKNAFDGWKRKQTNQ
jgi:ribonuclease P/MRP protein subunit RPP40